MLPVGAVVFIEQETEIIVEADDVSGIGDVNGMKTADDEGAVINAFSDTEGDVMLIFISEIKDAASTGMPFMSFAVRVIPYAIIVLPSPKESGDDNEICITETLFCPEYSVLGIKGATPALSELESRADGEV